MIFFDIFIIYFLLFYFVVRFIRQSGHEATEDQQSLRLTNERFVIPELLFHPSDVGIRQVGVQIIVFGKNFHFQNYRWEFQKLLWIQFEDVHRK